MFHFDNAGRRLPDSGHIRSKSPRAGRIRVDVGRNGAGFCWKRGNCIQAWTEFDQHRPSWSAIGRTIGSVGWCSVGQTSSCWVHTSRERTRRLQSAYGTPKHPMCRQFLGGSRSYPCARSFESAASAPRHCIKLVLPSTAEASALIGVVMIDSA